MLKWRLFFIVLRPEGIGTQRTNVSFEAVSFWGSTAAKAVEDSEIAKRMLAIFKDNWGQRDDVVRSWDAE